MARLRSRTSASSPTRDQCAPRTPRRAGPGKPGVRWRPLSWSGAPGVDACAAEWSTLDERHLLARLGQLNGKEPAALAGPDHDRVVLLTGHCVSPRSSPAFATSQSYSPRQAKVRLK